MGKMKTDLAQRGNYFPDAKSVLLTCLSALLFSTSFYELSTWLNHFRFINYFCLSPFIFVLLELKKINNFRDKLFKFSILILFFTICLEVVAFTWVYSSIRYFFHLNSISSSIIYILICLLSFPYYFILFFPIYLVIRSEGKYALAIVDIFLLSLFIISIEHFYPRLAMWFFGYSYFYDSQLRLIASYVGAFGLSFLFFYSNILIAVWIEYSNNLKKLFYSKYFINIVLLFCVVFFIHTFFKNKTVSDGYINNVKIAYIQPNFSAIQGKDIGGKFYNSKSIEELIQQINDKNYDIIVIPESSIYYQFGSFPEKMEDILTLAKKMKKPILVQAVLKIPNVRNISNTIEKAMSKSFVVFPNEKISNTYTKWNLMPFGEEFPFSSYIPYLGERYLKLTEQEVEILPGKDALPLEFNSYKIGVFICYDSINIDLVHLLAKNGADFLINQANFYWMTKTNAIFVYSIINQFKAIESQKSLLFSTNNGPTVLFDKFGDKVYSNNLILKQDASVITVPINKQISFYTKYFYEIKIFILLTGILLFFYFLKRRV